MPEHHVRIGIDVGGSKISAIAIDDHGGELARRRVATPTGDYPATIRAIAALVHALERELQTVARIGLGTPGALSPATGLIKNANSICLNGQPLDRHLNAALGRRVRIANDADCFALSEAGDGAAAGCRSVFGVIVGTGTGGGIVIDGRLLRGPNAIAGEWGHNPLPWPRADELPGSACYCGKCGCLETWLSGPGLARDHATVTGRAMDAPALVAAAAQGDEAATATLERYEDRMARALAAVINLLDPDVIVLGGGLSNIARLYEAVPRRWGDYVFSDRVDTRLVPARFGDDSGVRGAARLWPPVMP
jgi:fructokinase